MQEGNDSLFAFLRLSLLVGRDGEGEEGGSKIGGWGWGGQISRPAGDHELWRFISFTPGVVRG